MNILITGAGSGLGCGLSHALAKEGHTILVSDRTIELASSTVNAINQSGLSASPFQVDVTSEADVARFVEQLGRTPVHVLINNAGLQHVEGIDTFPVAQWDQLMNVMVRGTFLMSQAILPRMRVHGFGRIIHIGSIHSRIASPFKSAYVAAKHAISGFSKALALETAGADITSNTICPAYIRTPLVDGQIAAQATTRGISQAEVIEQVMLEPMPKKAFVTYEEVAAAVQYLMSPLAKNVTGQELVIDGGWTCQ